MNYFKGTLGEGQVKHHRYSILTKDGRSLVQASNWGLVVKKGTVLVMSMIVEKLALDEGKDRAQRNACPHCNETDVADESWHQW